MQVAGEVGSRHKHTLTASHTKYLVFLIKMETFVLLLFVNAHSSWFVNSDFVKHSK